MATEVSDPAEKLAALDAVVNHVVPGRTGQTRRPSANELKATLVLTLPLAEASAKIRTGPPLDDDEDYALPHWAGVIPLRLEPGAPSPDPRLAAGIATPPAVRSYRRPG